MLKPMKKIRKSSSNKNKQENFEHQDSFLEKSYEAENYVLKHAEVFKKYAIVAVSVVALTVLYIQYQKQVEIDASSQFGIAMVDYKIGNTEEAEKKLNLIKSEFNGSEAAERAKFMLGKMKQKKGLNTEAKQEFLDFSGTDPLFKAAAIAALAQTYENDKSFSKAASSYQEAANIEERKNIKISYIFSAAVNYELANDKNSAKELYKSLLTNYDDFTKKNLVELKLELLK